MESTQKKEQVSLEDPVEVQADLQEDLDTNFEDLEDDPAGDDQEMPEDEGGEENDEGDEEEEVDGPGTGAFDVRIGGNLTDFLWIR